LKIGYKSNRTARIIVYAVDEGILQVARYMLPNPLDHFLEKRALQVTTDQILDLILPEYSISKEVAAAGGDGREDLLGANLNPFKRKNEAPVVFWSGIIDCSEKQQEVSYRVPDYFNGSLRVMAVAVSDEAAGCAERKVVARGPFVIQPNVPTFVAPGDTFDVSVTVANNVEGSGANAAVQLAVSTSPALEIVEVPAGSLTIAEGRDAVAHVLCRAKTVLGNADIAFSASYGKALVRYTAHLSVRPPVPYRTDIKSGTFTSKSETVALSSAMYPHYFKSEVSASLTPLGLARGLRSYLDGYPHGCSEQVTSQAFPLVVMAGKGELGATRENAVEVFAKVCAVLRSRQNDQGAFGLWKAGEVSPFDFVSVYVMQMLTEAKDRDFEVMPDMMAGGLDYLKKMAAETPSSLVQMRQQALAIYLLTRNGIVATNYLDRLRDRLDVKYGDSWKNDLAGVYCAGAYAQLRNQKEAEKLIAGFQIGKYPAQDYYDFYSNLGRDSQYLSILSRHFPDRLRKLTADDLQGIFRPIIENRYNTHGAAYAILGLQAYSDAVSAEAAPRITISAKTGKGDFQALTTTGTLAPTGKFVPETTAVQLERTAAGGAVKWPVMFYQVSESGFDREVPQQASAKGIEVQREYRNAQGEVVDRAALGEELEVHVKVRAIEESLLTNVAIVDLLPGGFEVEIESVRAAEAGTCEALFEKSKAPRWELIPVSSVDVREDRVVIYGNAFGKVREFVYRIKAVNKGRFTVPPVQAESMYRREFQSRGTGATIVVGDK